MQYTINDYVITLEEGFNGVEASAMVRDSAGEYRHHKLYQGYDTEIILEMFACDIDYLSSY